jgi:hypothetical protein
MLPFDPRDLWCPAGRLKTLTTEVTEDHRGNRRPINVELFVALHQLTLPPLFSQYQFSRTLTCLIVPVIRCWSDSDR